MIQAEAVSIASPLIAMLGSVAGHGIALGANSGAGFVQVGRSVFTIAPPNLARLPNEITIDQRLPRHSFAPGSPVQIGAGELRSLDWRVLWDPEKPPLWSPEVPLARPANATLARRAMWLINALNLDVRSVAKRPAECLFTIDRSLGRLATTRHAIIDALMSLSLATTAVELTDVIGCGQGLTPSGDDFASALILALRAWRGDIRPPSIDARTHTSTLSATLLSLASTGMGLEPVNWLLDVSVADGELTRPLHHLLALGHTTGRIYATTLAIIAVSMSKHFGTPPT